MADCAVCRQPIHDTAYVDAECAGRLVGWLRDAADLAPELDAVLAKQARYVDPGPRPRNSAPAESVRLGLIADPATDRAFGPATGLPYAESASIDIGTIRNTVGTWLRVVVEQRYGSGPSPAGPICLECDHASCERLHDWRRNMPPPVALGDAMRWLAGKVGWLRYQPFVGEAFDELAYVARLVVFTVDRPVPRVDAGLCLAPVGDAGDRCGQRLSSPPGAVVIVCPACRTPHSARQRREVLLRQARTIRGSAGEVAQWLTILGITTTAAMVRGLAHRGRVAADAYGRYALGEVERCRLEQIEREQRTGKRGERMAA